jgi:glycosyltransferase involved in cell wall biosynthesis
MDLTIWPYPERTHVRWLVRLTMRCASLVLTIRSRLYLGKKLSLRSDRVLAIESCPDAERVLRSRTSGLSRYQRAADEFVICCSGGHEHHRLDRFLPIFEALVPLMPNAVLLVIAAEEKPIVQASRTLAERLGLQGKVRLLSVIKPVEDFYATIASCDLWIATLGNDTLQGDREFRMELLEAGVLGLPVASARTTAFAERGLADGEHVVYIDPADPAFSAAQIAAVTADRLALRRMGETLAKWVEETCSLSSAIDDLLHTLEERDSRR